jgi:hypothetical protein
VQVAGAPPSIVQRNVGEPVTVPVAWKLIVMELVFEIPDPPLSITVSGESSRVVALAAAESVVLLASSRALTT